MLNFCLSLYYFQLHLLLNLAYTVKHLDLDDAIARLGRVLQCLNASKDTLPVMYRTNSQFL